MKTTIRVLLLFLVSLTAAPSLMAQQATAPPAAPPIVTPPAQPVTPPVTPILPPQQLVIPPSAPVVPPAQPVFPPPNPVLPPQQAVVPPTQPGFIPAPGPGSIRQQTLMQQRNNALMNRSRIPFRQIQPQTRDPFQNQNRFGTRGQFGVQGQTPAGPLPRFQGEPAPLPRFNENTAWGANNVDDRFLQRNELPPPQGVLGAAPAERDAFDSAGADVQFFVPGTVPQGTAVVPGANTLNRRLTLQERQNIGNLAATLNALRQNGSMPIRQALLRHLLASGAGTNAEAQQTVGQLVNNLAAGWATLNLAPAQQALIARNLHVLMNAGTLSPAEIQMLVGDTTGLLQAGGMPPQNTRLIHADLARVAQQLNPQFQGGATFETSDPFQAPPVGGVQRGPLPIDEVEQ